MIFCFNSSFYGKGVLTKGNILPLLGISVSFLEKKVGLNIRRLTTDDDAFLKMFAWRKVTQNSPAITFLKDKRFHNFSSPNPSSQYSFIWSTLKINYVSMLPKVIWIFGDQMKLDFWRLIGLAIKFITDWASWNPNICRPS